MDGRILSLIGDVLNAWLPWFFLIAGIAAALAVSRFSMVMLMHAIGAGVPESKSGYQPVLFDSLTGEAVPDAQPAPAPPQGPWYRRLVWEVRTSLTRWLQSTVAYVRGDLDTPWWRVSFTGMERAFSRASWSVFFAYFFGALVCAAAVASGFPFAPTLAVYAILGIIWAMVLSTVTISLWIAQVSFLLFSLFAEVGAFLGFAAVGAAVLTGGLAAALVLRRARSYLVTIWHEFDHGLWRAPIWTDAMVQQEQKQVKQRRAEAKVRAQKRMETRRAHWVAMSYRKRLAYTVIDGLAVSAFVGISFFYIMLAQMHGDTFSGRALWILVITAVAVTAWLMWGLVIVYRKRLKWQHEAQASEGNHEG